MCDRPAHTPKLEKTGCTRRMAAAAPGWTLRRRLYIREQIETGLTERS
jgi:hypothetical protein